MPKYCKDDYINLFNEIDLNKDGGISAQELRMFFKAKKMELTDDKRKYLIRYFEKDYNGKIELGDWIDLCQVLFCDFVM